MPKLTFDRIDLNVQISIVLGIVGGIERFVNIFH